VVQVLAGCCDSANATYDYTYLRRYPVTSNHPGESAYVSELAAAIGGAWNSAASGLDALPLLEELTRAYCRNPNRLRSVRTLVEQLGGTAQGGGLYATSSTVNVINSTVAINQLVAGTQVGTSHSVGGHSSGGGTAQGGGLYSANGTLSPADKNAIQLEVSQLQQNVLDLSNSKSGGTFLFSGTRSDRAGGTPGLISAGGFGFSVATATRVEIESLPLKGMTPVQSRYRTKPRMNRSQRPSSCAPAACSGAM